jgi:uncharacterized Zn finger protein
MREDARTKASRYLVEARVRILTASEDGGYVSAEVRSDHSVVYVVAFTEGAWTCTCPAFNPSCAHVLAVQRVVVFSPRGPA